LSFGCSALATGGIHVGDAVRTQGGAPWNWSAAESPMLAAALLVLIASAVFVAPPRLAPEHRGAGALVAMLAITHWLNTLFVAGVAAALFLGGWRMPGVSPTDPSHVLRAAGAAVFLLKTWAVLGVVLCAGWVAARSVPVGPRAHHRLRWMMPCGAIALAATALVELGPLPSLPGALRDGLGVVATAAVLAMVAGFVARVLVAVRGKAAQLNVNPWL
jgi:NADH-quinone oxidoreductase subunit H